MSLTLRLPRTRAASPPLELRSGSVPALDFSHPRLVRPVVWRPGRKPPNRNRVSRDGNDLVAQPPHAGHWNELAEQAPPARERRTAGGVWGRSGRAPPHRRAPRLPIAQQWAHLGSNQERPGYEPGALTD